MTSDFFAVDSYEFATMKENLTAAQMTGRTDLAGPNANDTVEYSTQADVESRVFHRPMLIST